MKSAIVGAVAGFLAFLVAWVGWAYMWRPVEPGFTVPTTVRSEPEAPSVVAPIAPSSATPPLETAVTSMHREPLPAEVPVEPPAVSPAVAPAPTPAPEVVAAVVVVPETPVKSAEPELTGELPRTTEPADEVTVSLAVPTPAPQPPTRTEAEIARSEEAISKFASAQEALRNFRLGMPPAQAPATVDAPPTTLREDMAPPLVTTQPAVPSAAQAVNVATPPTPAVSANGQTPAAPSGLTELEALARAADAMKRFSKKMGSHRFR